jgi:hypothetical protein
LQKQAEMMIARPPVAIDVNDKSPSIAEIVLCDRGILGFFATRITFLRVIENGMREFARALHSLGFPNNTRCVVVVFFVGSVICAAVITIIMIVAVIVTATTAMVITIEVVSAPVP